MSSPSVMPNWPTSQKSKDKMKSLKLLTLVFGKKKNKNIKQNKRVGSKLVWSPRRCLVAVGTLYGFHLHM